MKLDAPFYQLPVTFDAGRLREEVSQFDAANWKEHPQSFDGNSVVHFVSVGGGDNDIMLGTMAATPHLSRCAYIRQILARFNTPIGRSRLMILAPGANVPEHTDIHYYWRNRVRIHIPIQTHPDVEFHSNGECVHMGVGEAWIFDNWAPHKVVNSTELTRIHLVIDTVGSAGFWRSALSAGADAGASYVPYQPGVELDFELEQESPVGIMHPAEVMEWCRFLCDELIVADEDQANAAVFRQVVSDFCLDWRANYLTWNGQANTIRPFREAIQRAEQQLDELVARPLLVSNNSAAAQVFKQWAEVTINPDALADTLKPVVLPVPVRAIPASPEPVAPGAAEPVTPAASAPRKRLMDAPVFLVSAPRSGSTLLFETLACAESIWTIGGESHGVFEDIPMLQPGNRGFSSNRLTEADVSAKIVQKLNLSFVKLMKDHRGKSFLSLAEKHRSERDGEYFLEKTPKNALRIKFLKAAYPNARFIFLHRHPRDNISSIIDAWRSGRFRTYPNLPGWAGLPWSLLLIPGWRELSDKPLEEVAAQQWLSANQHILDDLSELDEGDWFQQGYEDFISQPEQNVKALCEFIGIPFDQSIAARVRDKLPNSRYTVSAPSPDKWQQNEKELSRVLPSVQAMAERLGYAAITESEMKRSSSP